MNKKIMFFFLLLLIVLYSCNKKNKVKISGVINNAYGYSIKLSDPYKVTNKTIDSTEVNKNGKFSFKINLDHVKFLELELLKQSVMLIAKPGENIIVHANAENFGGKYEITGSAFSKEVKKLNTALGNTQETIDSLLTGFNHANSDAEKDAIEKMINKTFDNHKKFIVAYVLLDLASPVNVVALYQKLEDNTFFMNTYKDLQYFKLVNDSLKKRYTDLPFVKALNSDTEQMLEKYYRARLISMAKNIKSDMPDIKLPDVNNDSINLASLKGKIVLLSFWNPGAKDNLRFNNMLKPIYSKYKNKGFEIYMVSFERDKGKWKHAVNFEEYNWKAVNDENASFSKYKLMYNITQLPTTFLLDKTQEDILGKDLTVKQLDLKLNYEINKN